MRVAVVTYVYNENINLAIWRKYYGKNFGDENLYVIDRESNDGSTDDLGKVNVIRTPRVPFDDVQKSVVINSMHALLLQSFDCVIVTDCDEIIVVDPEKYGSLKNYIETNKPAVAHCIGLNLRHIITDEPPLELDRPILSQRRIASFDNPTTKPLISSVPTLWEPGGHVSNVKPHFDPNLFVFHTKWMDYGIAMQRQAVNVATPWSEDQEARGHGRHHRYDYGRFVQEGFFSPVDVVRKNQVGRFDFEAEIKAMIEGTTETRGNFYVGRVDGKYVEVPERFASVF